MSVIATPAKTVIGESALRKEQEQFKELFARLIDAFLNRLFDLRPEKARRRMSYFFVLFFISGFLVSLYYNPLNLWVPYMEDVFSYLISTNYVPNYLGNPFENIIFFVIRVFTDARVLQYLPIYLAPFFIALQSAAIYLADVFELEDIHVARSFIWEVALTGSDQAIRITQGDISSEHRNSSNYLIGGPGRVVVDLDSAALFEKPDGTPRVIGPTGNEPGGKATLDGFERFRQAADLHDHFIELRDLNGDFSEIKSRSLDGIPVSTIDVRFMFSVLREDAKKDKNPPLYSFNEKAIEALVYKAESRVTPELKNPSTFDAVWVNSMVNLIRERFARFMSEHNLTEYLASIGMPEYEKAKELEEKIAEEFQRLAPSTTEDMPKGKDIKPPPEFKQRYEIKNLFSQFADEFTGNARDRGVQLHWIGVGTWKTPIEVVPGKHLEAWKISRENLSKGSDGAFEKYKNEASLQETMTLIQDVPVAACQKATEKHPEHKNAMQALLLDYRQQLMSARDFITAKGEVVPKEIEDAINNINKAFGHFIN